MFVVMEKKLSDTEFYDNFNNIVWLSKTWVLFSLKKESSPDLITWGYGYNEPHKTHAEILVLEKLKEIILKQQVRDRYEIKLFISFSPCNECSKWILNDFLSQINEVSIEIKASRLYYFNRVENQQGLHLLKSKERVSINTMKMVDYEECFKFFVDSPNPFRPWDGLEEESDAKQKELNAL